VVNAHLNVKGLRRGRQRAARLLEKRSGVSLVNMSFAADSAIP
jgi:hypothetical protein